MKSSLLGTDRNRRKFDGRLDKVLALRRIVHVAHGRTTMTANATRASVASVDHMGELSFKKTFFDVTMLTGVSLLKT